MSNAFQADKTQCKKVKKLKTICNQPEMQFYSVRI